jgi:hypothetical protein
LTLGDSNDQFIVVEQGLKEGDKVVLNPLDFVEEAQSNALKPNDKRAVESPKAEVGSGKKEVEDQRIGIEQKEGGDRKSEVGSAKKESGKKPLAGGKPAKK